MALKIIWSPLAQKKRKEILGYWVLHNNSNKFSIKLDSLFIAALNLISRYPLIGKPTDIENVRVKIVRDYLIFYYVGKTTVKVLTIWDSRQNPEDLKIKM
ncbi:MAG: type II toxin-antitoxin system RelE/ParE family toxin [Cyclobacteriaceae bacterium]